LSVGDYVNTLVLSLDKTKTQIKHHVKHKENNNNKSWEYKIPRLKFFYNDLTSIYEIAQMVGYNDALATTFKKYVPAVF